MRLGLRKNSPEKGVWGQIGSIGPAKYTVFVYSNPREQQPITKRFKNGAEES